MYYGYSTYYSMYYGTVVHNIVRTTTKNASTYYSHDVLRANTSFPLIGTQHDPKCDVKTSKKFTKSAFCALWTGVKCLNIWNQKSLIITSNLCSKHRNLKKLSISGVATKTKFFR